jgi:PAS domain S-box-containing protein
MSNRPGPDGASLLGLPLAVVATAGDGVLIGVALIGLVLGRLSTVLSRPARIATPVLATALVVTSAVARTTTVDQWIGVILVLGTVLASAREPRRGTATAVVVLQATALAWMLHGPAAPPLGLATGATVLVVLSGLTGVAPGPFETATGRARRLALALALAAPPVLLTSFIGPAVDVRALLVVVAAQALVIGAVLERHAEGDRVMTTAQHVAELLTAASATSVLVIDGDGVVVESNPAADALLAGSHGSLVGTQVETLIPEALRHGHRRLRADFEASGGLRPMRDAPVVARTLDGHTVDLEIGLAGADLGSGPRVVAVLRDITAVRLERERLQQEARGRELLVEQLTQAEAVRSGLVGAASHELRTPVTVILGTAELLLAHGAELDAATTSELLERQVKHVRRLAQLVQDLSTVDPAMEVRTNPTQLDLGAAVRVEVDRWLTTHQTVQITLVLDTVPAWVDRGSLRRIVEVLLDNSHRYGLPPFAVHVAGGPGGAQLDVSDAGPGIPAEHADSAMAPFGRGGANAGSRPQPGLGLGLSVARVLAEANGGRLDLLPSPVGTRVRLMLPGDELHAGSAHLGGVTDRPPGQRSVRALRSDLTDDLPAA